jgi:hypothetical protein
LSLASACLIQSAQCNGRTGRRYADQIPHVGSINQIKSHM